MVSIAHPATTSIELPRILHHKFIETEGLGDDVIVSDGASYQSRKKVIMSPIIKSTVASPARLPMSPLRSAQTPSRSSMSPPRAATSSSIPKQIVPLRTAAVLPRSSSLSPRKVVPPRTKTEGELAELTTSELNGLIRDQEDYTRQLQDQYEKLSQVSTGAEAEQFKNDIKELVMQLVPASEASKQKSSLTRMQEEHEKKRLIAACKRDPATDQQRRDVLNAQESLADIRQQILDSQKELSVLRARANAEVSSKFIMRDERKKRVERVAGRGPIRESSLPPLPSSIPPPAPIPRSHLQRMEEQRAIRAQAKAVRRT